MEQISFLLFFFFFFWELEWRKTAHNTEIKKILSCLRWKPTLLDCSDQESRTAVECCGVLWPICDLVWATSLDIASKKLRKLKGESLDNKKQTNQSLIVNSTDCLRCCWVFWLTVSCWCPPSDRKTAIDVFKKATGQRKDEKEEDKTKTDSSATGGSLNKAPASEEKKRTCPSHTAQHHHHISGSCARCDQRRIEKNYTTLSG